MRRLANRLCIWTATALAVCSTGRLAYGQSQTQAPPEGGETAAEPPAELPSTGATAEVQSATTPTEAVRPQGERWKDILVLPRRAVLKAKRVEVVPMYHFNFNNPLIRHHGVGAQINYFLSEALWLGLEGTYYFADQSNSSTGTYFLIGVQDKVVPAVNKLIFSALLDFGYVPAQGKFALFNRKVVHWEGYVTLGVGTFMTQVIPVKRSDPAFTNVSAMFNVGLGSRLFITRWLALNAFLKMYGYPDTFEPVANAAFNRDTMPPAGGGAGGGCASYFRGLMPGTDAFEDAYSQCRKDNGNTTLVLDVVFGIGMSFFLPPKFEYKLAR